MAAPPSRRLSGGATWLDR